MAPLLAHTVLASLPPADVVLIALGALAGGFVSGLSGFGTGLTALPFWLYAVPPVTAAQLVAAASVAGSLQTLRSVIRDVDLTGVRHYLVAGLAGVPLGTLVLPHIDIARFKLGVGLLLVLYCSLLLIGPARIGHVRSTRLRDMLVGFGGGLLGGIAGLSGPLPTIWSGLIGLGKDHRRALLQTYNFTILTFAVAIGAVQGLLTAEVVAAFLLTIPCTIIGTHIGHWLYGRLDDRRYDRIVLAMLLLAGLSLLIGQLR